MRLYAFQFLVFVALAGCTTQNVEINIHHDGEVVTTSPQSPKQNSGSVAQVEDDFGVQLREASRKTEKPTGWCPRFVPPALQPTPAVPKDIQNKKQMTDEELISVLTEYARELRKVSLENHNAMNAAYKRYMESCKK